MENISKSGTQTDEEYIRFNEFDIIGLILNKSRKESLLM